MLYAYINFSLNQLSCFVNKHRKYFLERENKGLNRA
jgi:hypothetical protein